MGSSTDRRTGFTVLVAEQMLGQHQVALVDALVR